MNQMDVNKNRRKTMSKRGRFNWLALIAITLGIITVSVIVVIAIAVFSSDASFLAPNQPQPHLATSIEADNSFEHEYDDEQGYRYSVLDETNSNQLNSDVIADTDIISQSDYEDYVDSSYMPALDEDLELLIDDYGDIDTQQDVDEIEENETIVSEIRDIATDLNDHELDTNITIRFISEIGLTYDIYIPALAPDNEVRYIMLHHTYGLFETDSSLRGMHNDHRNRTATLDGGGIAYSEIIQRDGTVWIARGELRPSHTGVSHDIRTHSYSITVTGNFHAEGAIMSDVQFNSLTSRVAAAMRQFPNATIVGHGDLAATSCPGRNFPWDRLEESIGAVRRAPRGENVQ